MALIPEFVADKSALARFRDDRVAALLSPLLADGAIATCAIIDLEVLYSARGPSDYEAILAERSALPNVPVTAEVMADAITVQRTLAGSGRHRVAIADLIVAAAARSADLTVLHYDRDFETIASAVELRQRWIAPAGALD